jgi:hypothetical protein
MDAKEAIVHLRSALAVARGIRDEDNPHTRHYHQPRIDAIDLAIASIERDYEKRWRRVSVESPPLDVPVLVTVRRKRSKKPYVREAVRRPLSDDLGEWAWFAMDYEEIDGTVTHWTPMPDPAKEDA